MPFPVSWLGINTVVLRQAISVLSFVCCIYNHLVLCPLINKARDAAEDGERRQHALCCSSFLQKAVMRSLHSRGCDDSYKGGSLCFAVAAAQRGAPSTVGVSGASRAACSLRRAAVRDGDREGGSHLVWKALWRSSPHSCWFLYHMSFTFCSAVVRYSSSSFTLKLGSTENRPANGNGHPNLSRVEEQNCLMESRAAAGAALRCVLSAHAHPSVSEI